MSKTKKRRMTEWQRNAISALTGSLATAAVVTPIEAIEIDHISRGFHDMPGASTLEKIKDLRRLSRLKKVYSNVPFKLSKVIPANIIMFGTYAGTNKFLDKHFQIKKASLQPTLPTDEGIKKLYSRIQMLPKTKATSALLFSLETTHPYLVKQAALPAAVAAMSTRLLPAAKAVLTPLRSVSPADFTTGLTGIGKGKFWSGGGLLGTATSGAVSTGAAAAAAPKLFKPARPTISGSSSTVI